MGLFREILEEGISNLENSINAALSNHNAVKVNYESQTKDIASGERIIYPIAYGISTADNPVLRVYQPYGDTASKVPSWKLFRVDGIKNWEATNDIFTTKDIPNLRLKHDDQMGLELKSAFGGETPKKEIDDTPVTKQEIEPGVMQQTSNEKPSQNMTVAQEKPLDNFKQNTDIPSGINPQTQIAPKNEPITKDEFSEPEKTPTDNTSMDSKLANPSEPITRDSEELQGEDDGNIDNTDELKKVQNLMERINKIYKRK